MADGCWCFMPCCPDNIVQQRGFNGSQWQYGLVKHLGRSPVSKHPHHWVKPTHTKHIQIIIMKIQCLFFSMWFMILWWFMKECTMNNHLHIGSVFWIIFNSTFLGGRIWNAKEKPKWLAFCRWNIQAHSLKYKSVSMGPTDNKSGLVLATRVWFRSWLGVQMLTISFKNNTPCR